MKKQLIERITRSFAPPARTFALLAALCAVASASAVTNPVTGEPETYSNTFTGSGNPAEWNEASNWDTAVTPFISGGSYSSALVSGKTASTATSIDGWNLQVGAYNGAAITWSTLGKIQGDTGMWLTVDGTSSITINGWGGGNLGQNGKTLSYYVANANGVTWTADLSSGTDQGLTMNYYSAGLGSVSYQALGQATHVIMQADAELSGTSQVASKKLVSFTSCTKTFTASAGIKVKDGSTVLETVGVTSIRQSNANIADTTSALTTSDAVGSCEIVQCTDGIVLYWVDGDPNALTPTVYKPSININFTSGTALSTVADVGLGEYAIPGTSWNNLIGNNGSLAALNAVDSSGTPSATAASVTISGTRGYWSCSSLTAASDLRHGYIDESASGTTPTVTVSGIPYDKYRVIVYTATDAPNKTFGYITVNGKNYTYVNNVLTEDTSAWGASGGQDTAEAMAEGVNVLVSPVTLGSTLTVVGHRSGDNPRGCIAAIQIIEVTPEIGENDLEIHVSGDTNYTVSEAKTLSGTVYLTGNGTLTLDGSAKIEAATINVGPNVVLNINADRLDATTFTGEGTVVYNNALPVTGKGWTDSANWTGTVWINGKSGVTDFNVNSYGNANSAVKLSGVDGWVSAPFDNTVPVILENGTFDYALKLTNGNSPNDQNPTRCTTFVKVSGSGTISDGSAANPMLKIYDGTEFTGTITLTRAKVVFCSADSTTLPAAYTSIPNASVYVDVGNAVSVASGKTWTADGGFIVDGTLTVDGTIASSHASKAVSGSGTVVFNGKLPSPTGDAWWTNSDWDGTVQIKSAAFTGVSGVATYLDVNKYGNDGSILELNNCSGWLPVGNTIGDNVCTVPLKVTGTLTINDGYSGRQFTINRLLGNGAIYTTSNGATVTIQVLNADDFTGYVQLNSKRVVFGETVPETFTSGQIYVGSGFTLTVPNSNVAWYGTGSILLDGELKATALSNFGGGTTITTTDNGVFTLLTPSGTVDDQTVSYARITGTGTLRYADGGSDNWRTLSQTDFPTGMICENNLSAGLILKTAGGDHTIGSLAGSGKVRSDWGNGNRNLKALQAKDTVYSGLFDAGVDRVGTFTVAPGASSAGTLTLSGTQTASNDLVIESGAAVNLTGTWVGATTVAGTFGGTGTLTGDLTFTEGATLKVSGTGDSALTASGAVTLNDFTIELADAEIGDDNVAILKGASMTSLDGLTVTVTHNGSTRYGYTPTVSDGVLYIAKATISNSSSVKVGYIDSITGAAVITNATSGIELPANIAGVMTVVDGTNVVYSYSGSTITDANKNSLIYVFPSDADGEIILDYSKLITSLFTLTVDDTNDKIVVALNEELVRVSPTAETPVTVGDTTTSFSVPMKAGLWYAVKTGTSVTDGELTGDTAFGDAYKPTTNETAPLSAPTPDSGVKYYKIAVGASKASVQ